MKIVPRLAISNHGLAIIGFLGTGARRGSEPGSLQSKFLEINTAVSLKSNVVEMYYCLQLPKKHLHSGLPRSLQNICV